MGADWSSLRGRPVPIPVVPPRQSRPDRSLEFSERLRVIEESLLRLIQQGRAGPSWSEDQQLSIGGLQSLIHPTMRAGRGPSVIHPTVPPQQSTSFDEELLEIIMSGPPPSTQPMQAPPPLIPLICRRGPRARCRSKSPTFEADRPTTNPVGTHPPPPNEPQHPTRRPSHLQQPGPRPSTPPTAVPHLETGNQPDIPVMPIHAATALPPGTGRQTFPPRPPQLVAPSSGQLADREQQSEITTYLCSLDQWLERDLHARHAEIQSVAAHLERTRTEVIRRLNQSARAIATRSDDTSASVPPAPSGAIPGMPMPGVPPPGPIVIPPSVSQVPQVPQVVPPFPPGFVPQPVPWIQPERTPSPDSPVVPVVPPHMPEPVHPMPVIPPVYSSPPAFTPPSPILHIPRPPASDDADVVPQFPMPPIMSPTDHGRDIMAIPPRRPRRRRSRRPSPPPSPPPIPRQEAGVVQRPQNVKSKGHFRSLFGRSMG